MALEQNEDRWFANMLHLRGVKKGTEFMETLAKQQISFRKGRTLLTQLLVAGEFDLQIVAYWYRVHLLKKAGRAGGLAGDGAGDRRPAPDQHH